MVLCTAECWFVYFAQRGSLWWGAIMQAWQEGAGYVACGTKS